MSSDNKSKLGTIYFANAGQHGEKMYSKIGYIRPGGHISIKEKWLNAEHPYHRSRFVKNRKPFGHVHGWKIRGIIEGYYSQEQMIHKFIQKNYPIVCGNVLELYHLGYRELAQIVQNSLDTFNHESHPLAAPKWIA